MTHTNQSPQSEGPRPPSLQTAYPDEFLPSIGHWTLAGGLVMLAGMLGASLLTSILKYQVVVKAPASIRPTGELRLVQAATDGTILRIDVQENQSLHLDQPIAQIDDSRLRAQHNQLQNHLKQAQAQLGDLDGQLAFLTQQIEAEQEQLHRAVASAEAEVKLRQRNYDEKQVATRSDMEEAAAAVSLAQEELIRYQQLFTTGAIAQLQVKEKEAALKIAQARLNRVKATLNPTTAEVTMAREKVAQSQSSLPATLARLNQERQQLLQKRGELQKQLVSDQKELQQVEIDLKKTVVRAPIAGVIQELNLRNPLQVVKTGEQLAKIAPSQSPLQIKARVTAQDISKVEIGQPTRMRVSACPYPDYGTLGGKVEEMSPDVLSRSHDDVNDFIISRYATTGVSYIVTIQPNRLTLHSGNQACPLQSGMEGQVEIISREESVLQFFLRRSRLIRD